LARRGDSFVYAAAHQENRLIAGTEMPVVQKMTSRARTYSVVPGLPGPLKLLCPDVIGAA